MAKLSHVVLAVKSARETVVFRNHAEEGKERVADDLVLLAAKKLFASEVDAGQSPCQILREDDVAGLFDEVTIAGFQTRTLQQTRDFGDEPCRIERNFEIVVRAC